jgi:hypothetical protein
MVNQVTEENIALVRLLVSATSLPSRVAFMLKTQILAPVLSADAASPEPSSFGIDIYVPQIRERFCQEPPTGFNTILVAESAAVARRSGSVRMVVVRPSCKRRASRTRGPVSPILRRYVSQRPS